MLVDDGGAYFATFTWVYCNRMLLVVFALGMKLFLVVLMFSCGSCW